MSFELFVKHIFGGSQKSERKVCIIVYEEHFTR